MPQAKKTMNDAQRLRSQPDADLKTVVGSLPATSSASESTARHDRECADGSTLTVTSVAGAPVEYTVTPAP